MAVRKSYNCAAPGRDAFQRLLSTLNGVRPAKPVVEHFREVRATV
jgi:hypothetical protein